MHIRWRAIYREYILDKEPAIVGYIYIRWRASDVRTRRARFRWTYSMDSQLLLSAWHRFSRFFWTLWSAPIRSSGLTPNAGLWVLWNTTLTKEKSLMAILAKETSVPSIKENAFALYLLWVHNKGVELTSTHSNIMISWQPSRQVR